jgi:hypothetical protein
MSQNTKNQSSYDAGKLKIIAKDCYDLANLPTRILLRYLNNAIKFKGQYDPTENQGRCIPLSAIQEELNRR